MPTTLVPGQATPALEVPLVGGETFSLAESKPEFLTLIEIYRGRHCPRCRRHLLSLSGVLPRLKERGVEAVAISTDPEDRAEEAHREWGLGPLRIGHSLTDETARAWGVYLSQPIQDSEPRPFAEPATFWVRPDGTLYAATYGTTPFSRPHWADWLEALDAIRARNYPPRGDLG
ncbi:MAG: peroxiredoxin-like family protein [Paracoccaceae bacterium]|nr:peroxiredoxin-like family protein [Paracoccaceae bacterium]